MQRELELKFRLFNEDNFLAILEKKDIYLENPVVQTDVIFLRKGKGFEDLKCGEPVVRIRKQGDKIITTIKKYVDGIKDRLEAECEILDGKAFEKFLGLLDFIPVVTVKKERRIGTYGDAIISFDYVDGLGSFVEVEIISDDSRVQIDLLKLDTIISELGLSKQNIVNKPYDEMLFERRDKL